MTKDDVFGALFILAAGVGAIAALVSVYGAFVLAEWSYKADAACRVIDHVAALFK